MAASFRKLAGATLALATACLAACSFGLDGLSGGATDGGAPDGSTALADGATADAGSTSPNDAGPDARVSCLGHDDALFCDSFGGPGFASQWVPTANMGGAIDVADASFVATVPMGGANGGLAEANIAARFPFPGGVFRTYVDLYIASDSNRGAYLDVLTMQDGAHTYDIALFARYDMTKIETDVNLDDGGFTTVSTPLPGYATLPLRTWMRAILEVDDTNAAAPTYTFSLENPRDTPATVLVGPTAIDWPFTPTSIVVRVGESDVNEPLGEPWSVAYENFALTKP